MTSRALRALRVVVDARMVRDGGIGTYLQNLIPRMSAARPHWTFTLLGDPTAMTMVGWDALPNARLERCRSGCYTVAEQIELPLRCPSDTDVYWAPHYNLPLLLQRPVMVTVHDVAHLTLSANTLTWIKHLYARVMYSQVGRRATTIVFDSEFSRAEMARLVPSRGKTAVAPLAVDDLWFRARSDFPERPLAEPYLVYVGNWKSHKNVARLLRAFRRAGAEIPHRLVLVGRREGLNADPAITRELSETGDRVLYLGEIEGAELRQWIAHADALVTVSLYEGFGLPPLEAMAAGCPCLVSTAGSLPEVCGDAALYCDPRDEREIAASIIEIVTNDALRGQLVQRGLERARSFSWDRCAGTTAELLEEAAR